MARHYYLTRSGRLRRKDNTLSFEPAAEEPQQDTEPPAPEMEERHAAEALATAEIGEVACEGMGDLAWEPEAEGAGDLTAEAERALASAEETRVELKLRRS